MRSGVGMAALPLLTMCEASRGAFRLMDRTIVRSDDLFGPYRISLEASPAGQDRRVRHAPYSADSSKRATRLSFAVVGLSERHLQDQREAVDR